VSSSIGLASVFSLLCATGCSVFLPAHPFSEKTSKEKVVVTPVLHYESLPFPWEANLQPPRVAMPGVVAAAAPIVAGFLIDKVVDELEDESKKYVVDYASFATTHEYYLGYKDGADLNLHDIIIERHFDDQGTEKLGFQIEIDVESSGFNQSQQLKAKRYLACYSKAKIPRRRALLPWTWSFKPWYKPWKWNNSDDDIDINVTVSLDAFTFNHDTHESAFSTIASVEIPIKKAKLNGDSCGSNKWESIDPKNQTGNQFFMIPRSRLQLYREETKEDIEYLGAGDVVIRAKVREYDEFGERVKRLGEKVKERRSDIVTKVKEVAGGDEEAESDEADGSGKPAPKR